MYYSGLLLSLTFTLLYRKTTSLTNSYCWGANVLRPNSSQYSAYSLTSDSVNDLYATVDAAAYISKTSNSFTMVKYGQPTVAMPKQSRIWVSECSGLICIRGSQGVSCSGNNMFGQVDASSQEEALGFTQISSVGMVEVDFGRTHACGQLDMPNGELHCWGTNYFGQISGNGSTATTPQGLTKTHFPPSVSSILSFCTGATFTCAIVTERTLQGFATPAYCWGLNVLGTVQPITKVNSPHDWRNIACSCQPHVCATTVNDDVYCWGLNNYGQLGYALRNLSIDPVISIRRARDVVVGDFSTYVRTNNHTVIAFGRNHLGSLGIGVIPIGKSLPTTTRFIDIAVGDYHTCAIAEGGSLFCWGMGSFGQLCTGDNFSKLRPTNVSLTCTLPGSPPQNFTAISCAASHCTAITSAGTLYGWGTLPYRMSNSTGREYVLFNPIKILEVVSTSDTICCLLSNGSIWCWGSLWPYINSNSSSTFTIVTRGNYTKISLGASRLCAVSRNGSASCFIKGQEVQWSSISARPTDIGISDYISCFMIGPSLFCNGSQPTSPYSTSDKFIRVPGQVTAFAVSQHNVGAFANDSGLTIFGSNIFGLVGPYGSDTTVDVIPTNGMGSIKQIVIGPFHACGRGALGFITCWGSNGDCQLGNPVCEISVPPTIAMEITPGKPSHYEKLRVTSMVACGILDVCGNNVRNGLEECDGPDLNGTCPLGKVGDIFCMANCTIDLSQCKDAPQTPKAKNKDPTPLTIGGTKSMSVAQGVALAASGITATSSLSVHALIPAVCQGDPPFLIQPIGITSFPEILNACLLISLFFLVFIFLLQMRSTFESKGRYAFPSYVWRIGLLVLPGVLYNGATMLSGGGNSFEKVIGIIVYFCGLATVVFAGWRTRKLLQICEIHPIDTLPDGSSLHEGIDRITEQGISVNRALISSTYVRWGRQYMHTSIRNRGTVVDGENRDILVESNGPFLDCRIWWLPPVSYIALIIFPASLPPFLGFNCDVVPQILTAVLSCYFLLVLVMRPYLDWFKYATELASTAVAVVGLSSRFIPAFQNSTISIAAFICQILLVVSNIVAALTIGKHRRLLRTMAWQTYNSLATSEDSELTGLDQESEVSGVNNRYAYGDLEIEGEYEGSPGTESEHDSNRDNGFEDLEERVN